VEYTPYGETWIEQKYGNGLAELPYRFTGKELDAETGFYYYGARYLDPKTSRWLSGDPALGDYLPGAPINEEVRKQNGNLPGQGGVFNLVNLHGYHYAGNNPVKYTDPDGRWFFIDDLLFSFIAKITGNQSEGIWEGAINNFFESWKDFNGHAEWLMWLFNDIKKQFAANGITFEDDKLNIEFDNDKTFSIGKEKDASDNDVTGIFFSISGKKNTDRSVDKERPPYLPDPIEGGDV
jgi:RHS repeat-associated protein